VTTTNRPNETETTMSETTSGTFRESPKPNEAQDRLSAVEKDLGGSTSTVSEADLIRLRAVKNSTPYGDLIPQFLGDLSNVPVARVIRQMAVLADALSRTYRKVHALEAEVRRLQQERATVRAYFGVTE
jgi:hypothetical protein